MDKNTQKPYINVDFFEDLTGHILESSESTVDGIGSRIHDIRKDKGLSIDEAKNDIISILQDESKMEQAKKEAFRIYDKTKSEDLSIEEASIFADMELKVSESFRTTTGLIPV